MTLEEMIKKHGFRLRGTRTGSQKTVCPKCSDKRTKKDDPCLSIRIDNTGIGWRCFNCNWSGGEFYDDRGSTHKVVRKTLHKPAIRRTYGDLHREARQQWIGKY